MKKIINLVMLMVVAVAFYACNGGGGGSSSPTLPNTTVLVYIIGTDLQSNNQNGYNNIVEMESVGSTVNMNVILQTGGAKESQGKQNIDWTRNQRWKVMKGYLTNLADLGPDGGSGGNMGSESTFANFVSWGVKNYPAQKYIVILWDHGGGINVGIGSDGVTESTIAVSQIANALNSVSQAQNVKFEIAGFDACLMATAEVGAVMESSSKYMAASEDVEPGGGWAYTPFLRYVTNYPTANGAQIGRVIADSYALKMAKEEITFSITDLSKMPALKTATNAFADRLLRYTQESTGTWKQIARARINSLDFSTSAIMDETLDLVDMQQFVGNAVNNINRYIGEDSALTAAGDELAIAIQNAVTYKVSTRSNNGATGLTVYFPSVLLSYPDKFYAMNTSLNGVPFFASRYTESSAAGSVYSFYDYYLRESSNLIANVTTPTSVSGIFSATVSNEYNYVLAAHGSNNCKVYFDKEQTTSTVTSCYNAMILSESATTVGSGFTVSFDKATVGTRWITIDGIPAVMIPETNVAKLGESSFNLYLIPVYANYNTGYTNSAGYLQIEQQPNGSYKVKGFQSSTTTPGKVSSIKKGWEYALAAYAESGTSYGFYRTDNVVTADSNGSFTIGYSALSGGKFSFIVNDLTGAIKVSTSTNY